ncbi:Hypp2278 [Branchiostoma lanceolatum]|uniref:Hypp2278 protein n=1 Tax=Branchiostoma lanceolatum TaxID=7740 RepID=A0A8J9ZPR6_BRALA|nr:Hypp2278 [Branchiostoma lanceolatum]
MAAIRIFVVLSILAEARKLHWDGGEEYAIGELMRDVDQGVDPEKEDEEMKIGVERFTDQVQRFSDKDKGKVKELFRENLGNAETETLFQDASKLAKEEDEKLKELRKDVGFQDDEKKAFKELVSDVIKGADAEAEGETELALMAHAEERVDKLNEDDKKQLQAMIASRYGEEQARRVFNEAKTIEKEEDKSQANQS